ncbi:unnamed protein product [Anisakis simplex]|uniref:Uncharacterized protein n=1 Tax=Anisakis simplex TaxID=6269 RepID=A0A3P6NII5_ANISI|nr:unnamed protein product [Anisakis simplex]
MPAKSLHGCRKDVLREWAFVEDHGIENVLLITTLFTVLMFFLVILSNTLPLPCGLFLPLFLVGASLGRVVGEILARLFPDGIEGGAEEPIYPGVYSVVGTANIS